MNRGRVQDPTILNVKNALDRTNMPLSKSLKSDALYQETVNVTWLEDISGPLCERSSRTAPHLQVWYQRKVHVTWWNDFH